MGGFLTYSNKLKIRLADVSEQSLTQYGAVSKEVAEEMAKGGRIRLQTDYCISITGIAGPDGGSDEKPVGTVWIALANENQVIAKRFNFGSDRAINRERSVAQAISMLYDMLIEKG
jgi:nicotinamide-nucleotide amidase